MVDTCDQSMVVRVKSGVQFSQAAPARIPGNLWIARVPQICVTHCVLASLARVWHASLHQLSCLIANACVQVIGVHAEQIGQDRQPAGRDAIYSTLVLWACCSVTPSPAANSRAVIPCDRRRFLTRLATMRSSSFAIASIFSLPSVSQALELVIARRRSFLVAGRFQPLKPGARRL